MLIPANESREIINKYEELWSKIRDLFKLVTKKSKDYNEKYMKIKFNSDDELPINKTIKNPSMAIVVRAIFYENSKLSTSFLRWMKNILFWRISASDCFHPPPP